MKDSSLYQEKLSEQASNASFIHMKNAVAEYKAAGGKAAWREKRMAEAESAPHAVNILAVGGKFLVRKERRTGPSYDKQEFSTLHEAIVAAEATGLAKSSNCRF